MLDTPLAPCYPVSQLNTINLNIIMQFLVPILSGVWTLIEFLRLYLGLTGNMNERVPAMAAFLLLTVCQLLVIFVLGLMAADRMPMDIVAALPQIIVLIAELLIGFTTVRFLMQKQKAEFFRECQTDTEAAMAPVAPIRAPRQQLMFDSRSHAGSEILPGHEPTMGDVVAAGVSGLAGVAGYGSGSPDSLSSSRHSKRD